VQNAIIGNDNSVTGGVLGALTLLATNYVVVRYLFRHRRLDELVAGEPTTLIEHGRLKQSALASELLSRSELLVALHRQGFAGVDEVETCVLEPGGVIFVKGKNPPPEERRQTEIIAGISALKGEMEQLRQKLEARS